MKRLLISTIIAFSLSVALVQGQAFPYRLSTGVFSFIKFVKNGLAAGPATAPNNVINIANETASTVGTVAEWSPGLLFTGSGWDTDDAVARTVHAYFTLRPVTGATVSSQLQLMMESSPFSGTYLDAFVFTNTGSITLKSGLNAATAGNIGFSSSSILNAQSNGDINFRNNAGTGFTSLSIVNDIIFNASTPTIGSGFGGAGVAIAGNSSAFQVTVGAGGAASGVVNFGTSFTNTPHCIASDRTTANLMRTSSAATNTITITGTMVAADVLDVICMGHWQ